MKPVEPIHTVDLFPPLSLQLLAILKTLQLKDWDRPTVCGPWSVKDVAAHLLGGNFGRLWKKENLTHTPELQKVDYDALVDQINQSNDLWVQAARRISPDMLIELIELTDKKLYEHFRSLPMDQPSSVSVAWAGENLSLNWFDIAREYTEKWLHQQHIREAIGQPLLMDRGFLHPVLDTFLRGLPHVYDEIGANEGTSVTLDITGPAGGAWTLVKRESAWQLFSGEDENATSKVQMNQDLAWRLFTKGIRAEDARNQIQIEGDEPLGSQVLKMISIMA